MHLTRDFVKASVSLSSLSSTAPESFAFTSPATGEQLLGYFLGWTASLKLINHGGSSVSDVSVLTPLTTFTAAKETVTCAWVKDQVQAYRNYDDVFEDFFLKSKQRFGA